MIITFHIAQSIKQFKTGRSLFEGYAASINVDLCFQGFAEELETIHLQYNLPSGCLMLVNDENEAVGCAAIRKLDAQTAELKRMYLKPSCRGKKIGEQLLQLMVGKAKELGYSKMRLDTLPQMKEAQQLYRKFGFKEIKKYRSNPVEGSIFMEKQLE